MSKHPNRYKFLKAPTIEQIEAVVKKAGVTETQFERYYGLYARAICYARSGYREMPVKYWHLFLEEPPKPYSKRISRTPQIANEANKKVRKKRTVKLSHLVV